MTSDRPQKTFAVVSALLAASALALSGCWPTTYSWNQKLTLEVESEGRTYTGSSVIEVRYWEDPFNKTIGRPISNSMRGEAAFVDIPGKGTLFALLKSPHDRGDPARVAFWAFGYAPEPGFTKKSFKALSSGQGRKTELPPDQYPMLVTFSDINDPMTVQEVDPHKFAAAFGPEVKLKAISIEITDEPLTEKIAHRLSWLADLHGGYLHRGNTSRGSPYGLHAGDFKKSETE